MLPDDSFKLEKLKVEAYSDRQRSTPVGDAFEAMFNPESFKRQYRIKYRKGVGINNRQEAVDYARSEPSDLSLKLILDGSGVNEFGLSSLGGRKTVKQRVDAFLALTYEVNSESHEPSYLKVRWGDLDFYCRLGQVEIHYTRFDRHGKALRAELDVLFLADEEVETRMARERLSSPDVTHTRVVRDGDTLPLLTHRIYGSSKYYLRVAQANGLDDFRNLKPGQTLVFPPLQE